MGHLIKSGAANLRESTEKNKVQSLEGASEPHYSADVEKEKE